MEKQVTLERTTASKSLGESSVKKRCSFRLQRARNAQDAIKAAGRQQTIQSHRLHRAQSQRSVRTRIARRTGHGSDGARRVDSPADELVLDLAGLAHDLRAPLAAIEQVIQLIVGEHLGELTDKQRTALHSVLRRCIDLENLIGNVLDLARSQTGHLQPAFVPVRLAEVVASSIERLHFLARYKQIRIHVDGVDQLPEVFADRDMLERVVTNLLSNALKVSPEAATVRVRGELASLTRVLLEIEDQGPGMDPQEVRDVLRPFVRGRSQHRATGTGLGLTIVRRLLKAQHANLSIRTSPGKGTTVGILLARFAPKALLRWFTAREETVLVARCVLSGQRTLRLVQGALAEELSGCAIVIPDPSCLSVTIVLTDTAARERVTAAVQRVAQAAAEPIRIEWLGRDQLLRTAGQVHPAGAALPARKANLSQAG